jgi:hypothetical protein
MYDIDNIGHTYSKKSDKMAQNIKVSTDQY